MEVQKAVGDPETEWIDLITDDRRVRASRAAFRDWLLGPERQQERTDIVNKYNKVYYNPHKYTLQELCLISYSNKHNRPINSIVFEVTEDNLQLITNRIVLEDPRGIPIHHKDLTPYTIQELENYIAAPFKEWTRAGGLEDYTLGGPIFWIDLWEITSTESNKQFEWFIPGAKAGAEAQEGMEMMQEDPQEGKEEGVHADLKPKSLTGPVFREAYPGGEHHQHQPSSPSSHQDTWQETQTTEQKAKRRRSK